LKFLNGDRRLGGSPRLGRVGELVAAEYLRKSGFVLLERNWSCRAGEIDIVAREGLELVFVEVKTRSRRCQGTADMLFENVDGRKRKKLRFLADYFVSLHYRNSKSPPCRIDLIGVLMDEGGKSVVEVRHEEAAL